MKKIITLLFCAFFAFNIFAETVENAESNFEFKFLINEGFSFGQITRIEKMENRSNFVRENLLTGAFVNFQTIDLHESLDFVVQLAAYYPVYNAFNGMKQFPKNKLNYALDTFFGATYTYDRIQYVPLDLSLGMHYMYQLTDEYHMSYLGLGFLGTVKLPVAPKWTIVNNYFFSIDDANLGGNKKIQPFAISYQYHIDLGVCFSKRTLNAYSYIGN